MFRRLRVLAAFCMVPIVLLANPTHATAATTGPWTQVDVDFDIFFSQDYVSRGCTFNIRHATTAVEVGSAGFCTGLPDTSPGGLQPGEAGSSYTITFDGMTDASHQCGAAKGGTLGPSTLNGTVRVAGSIPASTSTITGGTIEDSKTCNITEVCVRLMDSEFSCVGVDLDSPYDPTPVSQSCPAGIPHATIGWEDIGPGDKGPTYRTYAIRLRWTLNGAPLGTTAPWHAAVFWSGSTRSATNIGSQSVVDLYTDQRTSNPAPTSPVKGVQLWAEAPPAPGGWNAVYPGNLQRGSAIGAQYPTSSALTFGGWSQPEQCRFYFGQKIVNSDVTTADDPFGDGVSPYVPPIEPDPVEPGIDDPTPVADPDDDLGWLAMIWSVLKSIWTALSNGFTAVVNAVKGIAAAIADAVTGALKALFIPSTGYLDTKWDSVNNKWESTTPARYVETVQGMTPGSGVSGCGGLPLNVNLPGGVGIHENLGAACSGPMASAASITRTAITAFVILGGVFACIRAIGSGLGWNPAVGRAGVQ